MAKGQDKLDSLIESFKLRSREESTDNNVNNYFGKNKKLNRLIIMDDVSGAADVSKKFANFLTVSRKFGYNCVYVFHVTVLASQTWQKKIFLKLIYLIFLQLGYHIILLPKLFKAIVYCKVKSMFLYVCFG